MLKNMNYFRPKQVIFYYIFLKEIRKKTVQCFVFDDVLCMMTEM